MVSRTAEEEPEQSPEVERLMSLVDPEMRASLQATVDLPSTKAGMSVNTATSRETKRVDEARASAPAPASSAGQVAPSPSPAPALGAGLTLGDLQFDPAEAKALGFDEAATAAQKFRIGGPTSGNASPFASEWGQQQLKQLQVVPLQTIDGMYQGSPGQIERRLSELHFMSLARKRGTKLTEMDRPTYESTMAEALDLARKDVASRLGTSEHRDNSLVETDPDKAIQDILQGNLPMPALLSPFGPAMLAKPVLEAATGMKPEDLWMVNAMAPFHAMAKPGSGTYALEKGEDALNMGQEGKLSWFLRLAPSTAVMSWMLDPETTWEMGGKDGFGGDRHVRKVASGYDLTQDWRRMGELYDSATPWESGRVEKGVMGALPLGAIMLFEPDVPSIATGLIAAPVVKAAKAYGLGKMVVNGLFGPTINTWQDAIRGGKSISEVAEMAGAKGSWTRTLFDAVLGEAEARIATEAASEIGPVGALGGKPGAAKELDPLAGRNVDELAKESGDAATKAGADLDARTQGRDVRQNDLELAQDFAKGEYDTFQPAWQNQVNQAGKAAPAAVRAMRDAESRLVSTAALRGTGEALAEGDKVIDLVTGQQAEFLSFRAAHDPSPAAGELGSAARAAPKAERAAEDAGAAAYDVSWADEATSEAAEFAKLDAEKAAGQATARLGAAKATAATPGVNLKPSEPSPVALVRNQAGEIVERPIGRVLRAGDPTSRPGTKAVLDAMIRLKRSYGVARKELQVAIESGQQHLIDAAKKKLEGVRSGMIANARDVSFLSAELNYKLAREAVSAVYRKIDKLAKEAPQLASTKKELDALAKAQADMVEAASAKMVADRQASAIARSGEIFRETLDAFATSGKKYSSAIVKGTTEAEPMGRAVIDDLAGQAELDVGQYMGELIQRHGSDVVDSVIASPVGKALRGQTGKLPLTPKVTQAFRKVEEAIHGKATTIRRGADFGRAKLALDTLGAGKLVRGWSKESWIAWTYQVSHKLSRKMDLIGASAIGKMPRAVRDIARKSVERFSNTERELAIVARMGPEELRRYMTTTDAIQGVYGNRGGALADRALAYLRAIKAGDPELFRQDTVVQALKTAPLPSFMSAQVAPGIVGHALERVLDDELVDGAKLWEWLEEVAPAMFASQTGKADAPVVIQRFLARALAHGANQHDSMYDLMRLTGPGLGADAAKALDWLAIPEKAKLGVMDVDAAYRATAAYNLPKLSQFAGPMESIFKAKDVSNRLVRMAMIEGHDHWVPEAVWRALQDVPRNLAKELKEFTDESFIPSKFDKFSRFWRMTSVYGYALPRARHFVNTFFGDWSQMTTALGWRSGTRLALANTPNYIPIAGHALSDALSKAAGTNAFVRAVWDPNLAEVLKASKRHVIKTGEGPMTAEDFLREALEDGTHDAMASADLMEATSRASKTWVPWSLDMPPHIKAAAKFMEEIQHRQRLLVYLEARTGRLTGSPLTREQAREKLTGALFDWKTGIQPWEHGSIGRFAAFWSYRRLMLKNLGGTIAEAWTEPSVEYMAKAMTGRTKLARMRQAGLATRAVPEAFNWDDPEEYLDDEEQLDAVGKRMAPWWAKAQSILYNQNLSPARKLWYSEVAGREVTYESMMMPAMTAMDQLYILNLTVQTMAASAVMAAEMAGIKTSLTTESAAKLWEKNVDGWAGMMMPGLDDAVESALKNMVPGTDSYKSDKGIAVPQAQAILLHRLGLSDFMGVSPDVDGTTRVDKNMLGVITKLLISMPQAADIARNWAVFDNPAMNESLSEGVAEAMSRWTGIAAPASHDPFKSLDYEAKGDASKLKETMKSLEKSVTPRRQ